MAEVRGPARRRVGMSASKSRLQVLVVGAGYAGATVAVRLAGRSRRRVEVIVVNPRPAFVNRLRLHHVAIGRQVAAPSLRDVLGAGVTFRRGGPGGVRDVLFDRVVIAAGSTTDLESAHRLRSAFAALREGAEVAVVGGGFTGLETVAELLESLREELQARRHPSP